jgi:hypothetical protein
MSKIVKTLLFYIFYFLFILFAQIPQIPHLKFFRKHYFISSVALLIPLPVVNSLP